MNAATTIWLICSETLNLVICSVCGMLLWRHRHEVPDRSRVILSSLQFCLVAYYVFLIPFSLLHPAYNPHYVLMPKGLTLIGLLNITLLTFYPMEMMRPNWLTWRHVCLMLLPVLLLLLPDVFSVQPFFRPLHSTAELIAHIGKSNVWLRLCLLASMFVYLGMLLLLPFNRSSSSADNRWIRQYVAACALLSFFYIGKMFTTSPFFHLSHQLWAGFFFGYYTWYELCERVIPSVDLSVTSDDSHETDKNMVLWLRITSYIDGNQKWRDPDLSFDRLCQEVMSNKTYVSQAFRQFASTTFSEYINRCRIDHVAGQMAAGLGDRSLTDVFFNAGFRTRSTAYRQFIHFKGMSPSEYMSQLKKAQTIDK